MPINVLDKKTGEIVAGPKKGNTTREVGKMKGRDGKMGGMAKLNPGLKAYLMKKKKRNNG